MRLKMASTLVSVISSDITSTTVPSTVSALAFSENFSKYSSTARADEGTKFMKM